MSGRFRRAHVAAVSIAIAAAAAAAGSSPAFAHQQSFPTTLRHVEAIGIDGTFHYVVRVESPRRECRNARRLTMTFIYGDESRRLVDRGRSSLTGMASLTGSLVDSPLAAVVDAPRMRFGPKKRRHRHVCRAASVLAS